MSLRVCFFINRLAGWGGVERLLIGILKYLNRSNWEVTLLLCSKKGSDLTQIPGNVSVVELGCEDRLVSMARALRIYLARTRPSTLITFMWPQNLAAGFANRAYTKLILSEQHLPLAEIKAGSWSRLKLAMIRRFYAKGHCIVAGSQAAARSWEFFLGPAVRGVFCIPNGVDISEILQKSQEPVESSIFEENCKYVITIARLIPRKNLDMLITAFRGVASVHPKARLLIVGDGPLRLELETLATDTGLSKHVLFLGLRTNPYKYLARSHVACLPSWVEGDGIVNKEALTLGVPVVASDLDCIREVVLDGDCGFLASPKRPEEFAEKLNILLSDEPLRARFSERARQRSILFSMDRIAAQYAGLIDEVIGQET